MKLFVYNFFAVCAAILLTGCASGPEVVAEAAPDARFDSYKTFAFVSPLKTDDGENQSIVSTHLMDATKQEMQARGYALATANPDLLIDFSITEQQKVSSKPRVGIGLGTGTAGGFGSVGVSSSGNSVETQGTLTVMMGERERKKIIWQASATGKVTSTVQENQREFIYAAIEDIFTRYPVARPAN